LGSPERLLHGRSTSSSLKLGLDWNAEDQLEAVSILPEEDLLLGVRQAVRLILLEVFVQRQVLDLHLETV
jgi:hypothetical protein